MSMPDLQIKTPSLQTGASLWSIGLELAAVLNVASKPGRCSKED